jgi:hypothetical protein
LWALPGARRNRNRRYREARDLLGQEQLPSQLPAHIAGSISNVVGSESADGVPVVEFDLGPDKLELASCNCLASRTPTDSAVLRSFLRAGRRVISIDPSA